MVARDAAPALDWTGSTIGACQLGEGLVRLSDHELDSANERRLRAAGVDWPAVAIPQFLFDFNGQFNCGREALCLRFFQLFAPVGKRNETSS